MKAYPSHIVSTDHSACTAGVGLSRQGDATLAAQPLTPPIACRRASVFAHARKTIMLSTIALLIPLSAIAQQVVSQRLMAAPFPLSQPNLQAEIWRDHVPNLLTFRKYLQANVDKTLKLEGDVFSTAFTLNGRTIVVSVLDADCGTTPIGNMRTCPARVAEVNGAQARILKEWPAFVISSKRGKSGYDASSNAQTQFMTIANFDPATRQLTFADVVDGQKNPSGESFTIP